MPDPDDRLMVRKSLHSTVHLCWKDKPLLDEEVAQLPSKQVSPGLSA
jgi:hypothetical protein